MPTTTILIIDDDPTTLGLLRTRLEKAGYKVKEAKDGQDGLKVAENEHPDLIFLDVRMPKVDGWQVCKTLKSNPRTAECPVIMLTGCSQDVQEMYGLQCGADEYITKPWDSRHLMDITARLLKKTAAAFDTRSDVFQQRIHTYIQRVVRMTGNLPKRAEVELMTTQLLRLATTFIAHYQTVLKSPTLEFPMKIALVEQQAGELLYWLGLLRDSKASEDPEIPLLVAEGEILRDHLSNASKKSRPT